MMRDAAKWLFTTDNIETPLSLSLIENIHRLCYPKTDNLVFGSCISNQTSTFGDSIGISKNKWHLEAKHSNLLESLGLKQSLYKILTTDIIATSYDIKEISKIFTTIAIKYEKILTTCTTHTSKIHLIAETAQTLELIHMFTDGNCRTIVNLWLNKELIRAGLSPAIFQNPNDFDWKTTEELVTDISDGQIAFNNLYKFGAPYPELCYSNQELEANIIALYESHLSQLKIQKKTAPYIGLLGHNIYLKNEQIKDGETSTTDLGLGALICDKINTSKSLLDLDFGNDTFATVVEFITNVIYDQYKIPSHVKSLCSLERFQMYCESEKISVQDLGRHTHTKDYLVHYFNFVDKLSKLINEYSDEKYFIDGCPFMFLNASTCHLSQENFRLYLSQPCKDYLNPLHVAHIDDPIFLIGDELGVD